MEFQEAQEKYLQRRVLHMATGLTFVVVELKVLGLLTKDLIEFKFAHPQLDEIPIGQPESASFRELETHYRILV